MRLRSIQRGSGSGPIVVLLHGLFGSAANLGVLQRDLAMRGARTIAMDLRNHGASPHADEMNYASMATDVRETLAAENIDAPVILLGHSMGGKVAMTFALFNPSSVAGLLVADIAPVAYAPHSEIYVDAMRSLPLAAPLTRLQADSFLTSVVADPAVRRFLLQNFMPGVRPGWRIGLEAIAANLSHIEGWSTSACRFNGATLFLTAELSSYVRCEHVAVIRNYFPAAMFKEIPGAGHWLHADRPEEVTQVVREFVFGIRPAGDVPMTDAAL